MRKILILTTALVAFGGAAHAQMYPQHMYSHGSTYTSPGYAVSTSNQVMRLPDNYVAPTTAYRDPNTGYPQQMPTYQPAVARAPMPASVMPLETTTQASAVVPSNMLPDDTVMVPEQTAVATTTIVSPVATVQPVSVTIPAPMPAPAIVSSSTRYETRQVNAVITHDADDTVQLRKSCDDELNHRSRSKAINTSTTVQGDCLN